MSTLFVDTINEKTSGNGIAIPGHVVQVSHTKVADATATTTQHSTVVNLGSAVSFTPKYATSKLLVTVSGNMKFTDGAEGCFVGLKRDGSYVSFGATQNAAMFIYRASASVNNHQSCSSTVLIDANAASATSFQLVFARYGGSGTAQVGNWHGIHLTIQEIAQ